MSRRILLKDTFWIALAFALLQIAHSSQFGLTDDEAYYWALSRNFSWGFAYHPPMVTWLLGLFVQDADILQMRFVSAVLTGIILYLSLEWVEEVTGGAISKRKILALIPLSLVGLFSLSWMMVPDLPLFVGWTLAFLGTWRLISQGETASRLRIVGVGVAIAVCSKFSGVLLIPSILGAVWFLGERSRRRRRFYGLLAVCISGAILGLIPSLVWNAQNNWSAILYQLQGRHGGDWSFSRWIRFLGSQVLVAGPVLFLFVWSGIFWIRKLKGSTRNIFIYCACWAAPGLIYFVQPLLGDFKPHWTLVFWFPLILFLTVAASQVKSMRMLAAAQAVTGGMVAAIVLVSLHKPILPWFHQLLSSREWNPKWDVSNDLYGWSEFYLRLEQAIGAEDASLPILASRYQVASQAAFAVGDVKNVHLIPRPERERADWSKWSGTSSWGPEWPKLFTPVLYVGDNRYDQAPQYVDAHCKQILILNTRRDLYPAKKILVWKCIPKPIGGQS